MNKQLCVLSRNPHDDKNCSASVPFIMASNDIDATAAVVDEDVEAEELWWCAMEKKVVVDASLEWVHGEAVPPSVPSSRTTLTLPCRHSAPR